MPTRSGLNRPEPWHMTWTLKAGFDEHGEPVLHGLRLLRLPFGWELWLHAFFVADAPGCFHTHPARAYRLVVWGGYEEEMADGTRRRCAPGFHGRVDPELSHRIDRLLDGRSSWSLWLRGPMTHDIETEGCR